MRTKICDWYDTKNRKLLGYGLEVFQPSKNYIKGEWQYLALNGRPGIFKTAEARDALRKQLQKARVELKDTKLTYDEADLVVVPTE
jgi:hypothetical protein